MKQSEQAVAGAEGLGWAAGGGGVLEPGPAAVAPGAEPQAQAEQRERPGYLRGGAQV